MVSETSERANYRELLIRCEHRYPHTPTYSETDKAKQQTNASKNDNDGDNDDDDDGDDDDVDRR